MRKWSEIVESMPEPVRKAFLKWWGEHPPFSYDLDWQALIAEAWLVASTSPMECARCGALLVLQDEDHDDMWCPGCGREGSEVT